MDQQGLEAVGVERVEVGTLVRAEGNAEQRARRLHGLSQAFGDSDCAAVGEARGDSLREAWVALGLQKR